VTWLTLSSKGRRAFHWSGGIAHDVEVVDYH
jgi:hypothetical protein